MTSNSNMQPNLGRGLFKGTMEWPFLLPGVCLFLFIFCFFNNRPRSLYSKQCGRGKQSFDFNCLHIILSGPGTQRRALQNNGLKHGVSVAKTDKPIHYDTLELHSRFVHTNTHSLSFSLGLLKSWRSTQCYRSFLYQYKP